MGGRRGDGRTIYRYSEFELLGATQSCHKLDEITMSIVHCNINVCFLKGWKITDFPAIIKKLINEQVSEFGRLNFPLKVLAIVIRNLYEQKPQFFKQRGCSNQGFQLPRAIWKAYIEQAQLC